jgi:hypothetical protein
MSEQLFAGIHVPAIAEQYTANIKKKYFDP